MKKTPKISKTDDSDLEENLIDELEDENSGVQINSSRKQTRKPSKASNVAKMLQFMEKNEEVRQAQQKTRTDENEKNELPNKNVTRREWRPKPDSLKFSLHPCQKKKKNEKVRRRREMTAAAVKSS